ncbi:unnamed protein product [Cylicostephanus goldi]|uniref:Uncharacterized protein n=1 Tax=Cylicostephanus goldi TaxID=71465 RepID=A0A3P7N2X1_CYLGO|nr:unnamed protein product [Cylicostephanus goldi]
METEKFEEDLKKLTNAVPNDALYPCNTLFYNEMKQALDAQLVNKPHEFNHIDPLALDKHIILDMIELTEISKMVLWTMYRQTQTSSSQDTRVILLWKPTHLTQIFVNSKF